MATRTLTSTPNLQLRSHILRWEGRRRLLLSALWLPRAVMAALLVGIGLAVVSRLRPGLLPPDIVLLTLAAAVVMVVCTALVIWLRPRHMLDLARRFDMQFALRERTSAALELMQGQIRTSDDLERLQIEDALAQAEQVRPDEALPLRWQPREWLLVLLLGVGLALLLLLPNPQADTASQDQAQEAALEAAAQAVREITRDTALNPALDEPAREALLNTLNSTLDSLQQPDISPEEAFAALSEAESALRDQGAALSQQAQATRAGLEAAAQSLRALPSLTDAPSEDNLSDLLNDLGLDSASFTPPERAQVAQALEQAADALGASSPQTAQELRDAAQAMQQSEGSQAQQELQSAQQSAAQSQESSQGAQQGAQQLSQSAEQAQQAGQAMSQQSSQNGQQPGEGNSPSPAQQGQPSGPPQSGDASQQSGAQGQPQSSAEQGQGQPSQSAGASTTGQQAGQGSSAAPSADGAQPSGQTGSASAGAGDTAASAMTEGSSASGQQSGDNTPDGQGEQPYDNVYAPTRLGGESTGPEIMLEPDTSQVPVQEGEFSQNPAGQASVPYNQVYQSYAQSANRALESDYVPLGLRDLVRDYFTGLEPGR